MENNRQNSTINWYPGHMAKTRRLIKERLDIVDVVIHVIDARIPRSSFIPDIEELTFKKKKLIFMSKYDLCDKEATNKWKKYYENKGYVVILSDLNNSKVKNEVIEKVNFLMKDENEKRKSKGLLPKRARVMIVGVSNVGKSTLINKLVNKKVAVVGNKPGVTKSLSMIKINDKIDLIDTPGVLWPKIEDKETALNLASMTIIKEEVLPLDEVAIHILSKLSVLYKDKLKSEFGLDSFNQEDIMSEYFKISRYKRIPLVNDEPDYEKISLIIVNSIKSESIRGITFDIM